MPRSEYQNSDRGVIELASGTWQVLVSRVVDVVDRTCSYQMITFVHDLNPGSIMRTGVSPTLDHIDTSALHDYGRNPDERNIVLSGERYCGLQIDDDLLVRGPNGKAVRTDLFTETDLGELTEPEMTQLAGLCV